MLLQRKLRLNPLKAGQNSDELKELYREYRSEVGLNPLKAGQNSDNMLQ